MPRNLKNIPISQLASGESLDNYFKGPDEKIWTPRPGSQEAVYNCEADLIGYGGQAGGGKTDCAFGIAYYKHKRSILFRSELSQMEKQIRDRGNEVFHGVATYIAGHKKRWEFNKGGILALGALKNDGDYNRARGTAWDAMFFDETPTIRKSEILSVMGWLRSEHYKCQAYMFFNPSHNI